MRTMTMHRGSLLLLAFGTLCATGQTHARGGPRPASEIEAAHARLPLAFQENLGQYDPQVKFVCRSTRSTTFLTAAEAVLVLSKPAPPPAPSDAFEQANPKLAQIREGSPSSAVLRFSLVGSAPGVPVGVDRLSARFHYALGTDPAGWRNDVPAWRAVRYPAVYPGVDLQCSGEGRQLKYDFVVAPGADPAPIRIRVDGAATLAIDAGGNLVLGTDVDDVVLPAPLLYQERAGVRIPISGRYILVEERVVGFEIGPREPLLPMVIDPVLISSTYLGGSGDDAANGIATDIGGNMYLTGRTFSFNFPAMFPDPTPNGNTDAFVVMIDAAGSMLYSTYLGGNGHDIANAIAAGQDPSTGCVVAGATDSSSFPMASFPSSAGNAFVAWLRQDGSVQRSRVFGGSGLDAATGVALGAADFETVVSGFTESTDFNLVPSTSLGPRGNRDIFVVKFAGSGQPIYSTLLGGSGDDTALSLALMHGETACIGVQTDSSDFPLQNPLQNALAGGGSDAAVVVLDISGSAISFSTYLGGSAIDAANGIAVDSADNIYVTGQATTGFPILNAVQATANGEDAFVAKIELIGNSLVYSTFLGGQGRDRGNGIAADAGEVAVTGSTESADFPTEDPLQAALLGSSDAFIVKLDAAGSIVYSTFLGGSGEDEGAGIVITREPGVAVVGRTTSSDFPLADPIQPFFAGVSDAFLTVIADGLLTVVVATADASGIAVSHLVVLPDIIETSTLDAGPLPDSFAGVTFTVRSLDSGNPAFIQPPNISSPAPGLFATVPSFLISGGSPASGLAITVLGDGLPLGSVVSGDGGAWSFYPQDLFSPGRHYLTAFVSDGLGNFSSASGAIDVTVDYAPPAITTDVAAVTGLRPALNARWSDDISGVVVSTGKILLDGIDKTSGAVKTAGGLMFIPPSPLGFGAHTVVVEVADFAGLVGTLSYSFTVAPQPLDLAPPAIAILSPPSGVVTPNPRPTISARVTDAGGSGLEPSRLQMKVNGAPVPATVEFLNESAATITYVPPVPLRNDVYQISVDAADRAGSPASAIWAFTVFEGPPMVTRVTSANADGIYEFGAAIDITVEFSEPVTLVGGDLLVPLDVNQVVVAIGPFGPATSAHGTYVVADGDNASDLSNGTPLLSEGATLRNVNGSDVYLQLSPDQVLGAWKNIVIRTTAPLDPPLPPTNVRTISYASAIDVVWDPSPSPHVAGYNVYRKVAGALSWPSSPLNSAGVVTVTRWRDDLGLSASDTYVYRVTAVGR